MERHEHEKSGYFQTAPHTGLYRVFKIFFFLILHGQIFVLSEYIQRVIQGVQNNTWSFIGRMLFQQFWQDIVSTKKY